MRLFQLLAPPSAVFSPASSPSYTSPSITTPLPPPSAPSNDQPAPPPSSTVTVPFFSVGGFIECAWYRRAVCIADEFVRTQLEHAEQQPAADDSSSADRAAGEQQHEVPQHTRIQSVTLPRQLYRHYLLSLKQHIDLRDHYSCPVILQGHCTLTGTAQQHAADYPLQHASDAGGVTGSAVACECKAETLVGGYSDFERLLREQYGFVATRCGKLAAGNPGGQC